MNYSGHKIYLKIGTIYFIISKTNYANDASDDLSFFMKFETHFEYEFHCDRPLVFLLEFGAEFALLVHAHD